MQISSFDTRPYLPSIDLPILINVRIADIFKHIEIINQIVIKEQNKISNGDNEKRKIRK